MVLSEYVQVAPSLPEGERAAFVQRLREEYKQDIDIERLASELVVDAVVPGPELRGELARRFAYYAQSYEPTRERKRAVTPV